MSVILLNGSCPHPVGDICIRTTNVNPSTTWPGTTWTEVAAGRVLVGADSSHAVKATGDPTHTHGMQGHTHGMQNHTHGLSGHTHTYGVKYAATWRTLVTLSNADDDAAMLELSGQYSTTQTRSQWNHETNGGVAESQKGLNPVIIEKKANTGGPSNNTSGGPSNNTSGGPSNDTTTASGCMPPWYGVHYWLRTA